VRDKISDQDWKRVHYLGRVPYGRFLNMMQVSRVRIYLTYPFVLSWSLLEAMSAGAAIVASDTAPVSCLTIKRCAKNWVRRHASISLTTMI